MKIIAISDLHGNLIRISESCNVVVIAGDWSPLYMQHDYTSMMKWINDKFIPWMKRLHTDHIVFIAGNHDLACTYSYFYKDLTKVLKRHDVENKVHYLNRTSITINGVKFYGIPDTEDEYCWAFSKTPGLCDYSFDDDTYVLITHQPPNIGDIGYIKFYNENYGSDLLRNKLVSSNVRLNICGHIHNGSHDKHMIESVKGNAIVCCNVSILDDDYKVAFEPTVLEI